MEKEKKKDSYRTKNALCFWMKERDEFQLPSFSPTKKYSIVLTNVMTRRCPPGAMCIIGDTTVGSFEILDVNCETLHKFRLEFNEDIWDFKGIQFTTKMIDARDRPEGFTEIKLCVEIAKQ